MYRICLVEDEVNLNNLIKSYLERESYEVINFYNGEEAFDYIGKESIHLWILDIMLGDNISGYDLIKKIREKFSKFTKEIWVQEVTDNETGNMLNQRLQEEFKLEELYKEIKNKYDVLYKEFNIKKTFKANSIVLIILIISLILNIVNFIVLINR